MPTMHLFRKSCIVGIVLGVLLAAGGWAMQVQAASVVNVPGDANSISEALGIVDPGGTITVGPGYDSQANESFPIEVTKSVSIICQSDAGPITVPNSHAGFVVRSSGVTIQGCTITSVDQDTPSNHGDVAIVVKDVTGGVTLAGNTIYKIISGIRLINAQGVTITSNTLYDIGQVKNGARTGIAIFLEGSDSNTLSGNVVQHPQGNLNHCGEGLFLFLSNGNTVRGDTYSGCTTNGVTINNSNGNTLENLTVTHNGSWGVDISLADENELNGSEVAYNKIGGIKLEGAKNNKVANPDKPGNHVHDNGDSADEDIQILVTSGEKVLFTAPGVFFDGNKPSDPWDTLPNDVRTEKQIVRQEIEVLNSMIAELDTELEALKFKLEAEAGIIFETINHLQAIAPQTQSTQLEEEKQRLLAKQAEIAKEKVLIVACKIGIQEEISGQHSVTDLPAWELQSALSEYAENPLDPTPAELMAFCVDNLPTGSLFLTADDPLDKDGDDITNEPSYRTIEDKKAELKAEITNIKNKLRNLATAGVLEGPCENPGTLCNQLLQKLDTMLGIVLNINSELELILKKLIVADLRLPSPDDKIACFEGTLGNDGMQACFQSFLQVRVPFTDALLGDLGQLNLFTFSESALQMDIAQSGSLEVGLPMIPNPIVLPGGNQVSVSVVDRGCGPGTTDIECFKVLEFTALSGNTESVLIALSVIVGPGFANSALINCAGSMGNETHILIPGASVTCEVYAGVDAGSLMVTNVEAFVNTTLLNKVINEDPSVTDAKLWVEEAIAEKQLIYGKIADFRTWIEEFNREIPPPPFEVNCLDLWKHEENGVLVVTDYETGLTGEEKIGCLIGKKEQGGNSISGLGDKPDPDYTNTVAFPGIFQNVCASVATDTDVYLKCQELVNKLNADDQAKELLGLLQDPPQGAMSWGLSNLQAHKIGGTRRESTGNIIANNAITYGVLDPTLFAPPCFLPERHPILGDVQRGECSIGIKVESPDNTFQHNWITNEDIYPETVDGDGTERGEIGHLGIGIVVLAGANTFELNVCEEVNTCIIKGGNNDREDVQHEHLFKKLATTKCGDLVDPLTCQAPVEKIIILEVSDELISVSKPDDKCPEKTGALRPGQVFWQDEVGWNSDCSGPAQGAGVFKTIVPVRVNFVNNFFEHRLAFDIVNAESDAYEGNLLLGSSVQVREGVNAGTEKWTDNDFINSALNNNQANTPINWAPNFGRGTQVINGSAPAAEAPFCSGNFTGGQLPPYLSLMPAGVDVPPGKPRTCADANVEFAAGADTVGVARGTNFYLRNTNTPGLPDISIDVSGGTIPIVGDIDADGFDEVGWYDPTTSTFAFRADFTDGPATLTVQFGPPNSGWVPVIGDWNGDGLDTVGLYDPTTSTWFLKNANVSGPADLTFAYGPPGAGWIPVVGDWNGDGVDTVGLYDQTFAVFYLRNSNDAGFADVAVGFGPAGNDWIPLAGNFSADLDQSDTIGLYDPATSTFFLRFALAPGPADATFVYGAPGDVPLIGDWDNDEGTAGQPNAPALAGVVSGELTVRAASLMGRFVTFWALGVEVQGLEVEVYDLGGRKVWSGEGSGNRLIWTLLNSEGRPVANGVYLYVVTVRDQDGEPVRTEVRKLVVLR